MRKYQLNPNVLSVGMLGNQILRDHDKIVDENMWPPNRAEELVKKGHLIRLGGSGQPKIGVLIPTRGDRPQFLHQALKLLACQTLYPDEVEVVNDPPKSDAIDITWRYRLGCERLFGKGCDVVIFWEDDDYYAPNYIEAMMQNWDANGRPEIFGIGRSIYYHVESGQWMKIDTPHHASAMSTMVTGMVMKIAWCPDNEAYTDKHLWGAMKGKTVVFQKPICLGIKHGIGKTGGGGHYKDWHRYHQTDEDRSMLRDITGQDFEFYMSLNKGPSFRHEVVQYGKGKPFLTIMTRCYKRPKGLKRNQDSIKALKSKAVEQVLIIDEVGQGVHAANKSFLAAAQHISGDRVFMLDDDDFLVNPDMIAELKAIVKEHDPDVIFVRMIIKNNLNDNLYPSNKTWGKEPVIANIGTGCFVVRKSVYQKHIHDFGQPRCGDYHFIHSVWQDNPSVYWHDVVMSETGKVSKGAPE